MNAEEVEQQYLKKMGSELGAIYHRLYNECAWLHFKWAKYVELFGKSEARVDLLNSVAGELTRVIEDSIWNDVLLHICRLTDKPKVAGRETLTLQRLPALVPPAIVADVSTAVADLLKQVAFARDHRNRQLAHADLALALSQNTKPLDPASRAMVKAALSSLAAALNKIEAHYLDATVAYDVWGGDDATDFLYVLRDGVRVRQEKMKRFENGTFTADDLKQDEPL